MTKRKPARWLGLGVLLISVVLIGAGCGSDSKKETTQPEVSLPIPAFQAGSTMDRIQKAGKLVAGVKFDQPGFGQKNPTTNVVEGFDIEVVKLIAQGIFGGTKNDAAAKVEFVESVSKNREPYIEQGKVDLVVATYSITDARKQVVAFAGPYYMAHGDIMVRSDNTNIKSVTDLNGKTVCTVKGSVYEATMKAKAPLADVKTLDTYSQCAEALRDKRVEAEVTDNVIIAGLVQSGNRAFKMVNASYTDEPYGIGLKRNDEAFRTFVNDRLEAIFANGQWAKAHEDTLGKLDLSTPQAPAIDRYSSVPAATTTTSTTVAP